MLSRFTDRLAAPSRVGVRDLIVLVALGGIAWLLPFVLGAYPQEVGFRILQLGALASAWNLIAGYTGLVSLGSAAFFGLGVYTMAFSSNAGIPLPLCILVAVAIAVAFAVVVSPALFRLRGLYFTVGTLALAEALRIFVLNSPWFGGQAGVFLTTRAPKSFELYWMGLVLAVLAVAVVFLVLRSRLSYRMQAVRDDEDVARQLGVRTYRTKLAAFAIAGGIMAAIGSIQALNQGIVQPTGAFGINWTIDIIAVTIIGGIGTKVGPWVGAVFIVLLGQALLKFPEIHLAIVGVILVLVIRFLPDGIWGSAVKLLRPRGRFR